MIKIFIPVVFLISNLVLVPTSIGDDNGKFKLKGKLFSASATITAGQSSALLAEVPEGKNLVVTQYCRSDPMGTELTGSELGRVPAEFSSCTTYVPGVLFKGGQSVSCFTPFGPAFQDSVCLINGVIR